MPGYSSVASLFIMGVLAYASIVDLFRHKVHDIAWILVAGAGMGMAVMAGQVYAAVFSAAVFGGFGMFLSATNRWGGADAFMLGAVGAAVYPTPYAFAYAFVLLSLIYLLVWRTLLNREYAPHMPMFLVAYAVTVVGMTTPF